MTAVGIYFFEIIFCLIASGRWFLHGEVNILNALMSFSTVSFSSSGAGSILTGTTAFFSAMINVLSWNAPYLTDGWAFLIKLPLYLISIGIVWEFRQVFLSVIQGLVGTVRSLIPGL